MTNVDGISIEVFRFLHRFINPKDMAAFKVILTENV